jgi:hypothetical protein
MCDLGNWKSVFQTILFRGYPEAIEKLSIEQSKGTVRLIGAGHAGD